jgi:hypothetical protein
MGRLSHACNPSTLKREREREKEVGPSGRASGHQDMPLKEILGS